MKKFEKALKLSMDVECMDEKLDTGGFLPSIDGHFFCLSSGVPHDSVVNRRYRELKVWGSSLNGSSEFS